MHTARKQKLNYNTVELNASESYTQQILEYLAIWVGFYYPVYVS